MVDEEDRRGLSNFGLVVIIIVLAIIIAAIYYFGLFGQEEFKYEYPGPTEHPAKPVPTPQKR